MHLAPRAMRKSRKKQQTVDLVFPVPLPAAELTRDIYMRAFTGAIAATLISMIFMVGLGFLSGVNLKNYLPNTLFMMIPPGLVGYWLLLAQLSSHRLRLYTTRDRNSLDRS